MEEQEPTIQRRETREPKKFYPLPPGERINKKAVEERKEEPEALEGEKTLFKIFLHHIGEATKENESVSDSMREQLILLNMRSVLKDKLTLLPKEQHAEHIRGVKDSELKPEETKKILESIVGATLILGLNPEQRDQLHKKMKEDIIAQRPN